MEKNNDITVIGQYGRIKEQYLKYNNPKEYHRLAKDKKLKSYLIDFNKQATEMEEHLAQQMAVNGGLTDEMKEKDPDKWIGLMNNYRMCAREIIIHDIIEE